MLEVKNIKYLVVHCSDTPDNSIVSVNDIHKMHLNFGWNGIGYHKIITRDGSIHNGRPEFWIGAHTKGINKISLGVCLIGRNNFLTNQFDSLEKVLIEWKIKYKNAKILGHKDAIKTKKTCPNFDVQSWCADRGL